MTDDGTTTWRPAAQPLASAFDILLFDLDGVIYLGPQAVPHARESVSRAAAEGLRCSYTTNNAARPPAVVAKHLRDLGIPARDDEVVTSAQEGADAVGRPAAPGQPGPCRRWARSPRGAAGVRARPRRAVRRGSRGRPSGVRPGRRMARPGRGDVRRDGRRGLGGHQPRPHGADAAGSGARQRSAHRGRAAYDRRGPGGHGKARARTVRPRGPARGRWTRPRGGGPAGHRHRRRGGCRPAVAPGAHRRDRCPRAAGGRPARAPHLS